jgi:hypothetical protein
MFLLLKGDLHAAYSQQLFEAGYCAADFFTSQAEPSSSAVCSRQES